MNQPTEDELMIVEPVAMPSSDELDRAQYDAASAAIMENDGAMPAELSSLGQVLLAEFSRAVMDRRSTEERWLRDLRQYKGQYEPDVLAELAGRSTAFVRKTRVKVKTTDSRVADMLFPAGGDKNWSIDSTPKPTLSEFQKAEIRKAMEGRSRQQAAMAMQQQQQQLQQAAQQAQQAGEEFQPPPMQPIKPMPVSDRDVDAAAMEAAKAAAKLMAVVIDDQLVEANYKKACLRAIHSGHIYGTGVIKGPLIERRVRTQYVKENGAWVNKSEEYITPFVDFVPLWRFYPDMSATELSGCMYVYELHNMTRPEIADLASRKSFDSKRIIDHIKSFPGGNNTMMRQVQSELRQMGERDALQSATGSTYEVIERWGYVSGEQLTTAGVKVPEGRMHESFFANVWLLPDGSVIKAVLQPINGVTWPYHIYYFDKDETSIFAEGLPAVMRDDQDMLNAATRMMLDNAGLTAGPMFEVTPSLLSDPAGATSFRPWKAFLRNQVSPGQPAIRPIVVDGNIGEMMAIAERFETQADETTAIPRYMTGENPSSGAAATMGGMSMLMGAANIVLKDLVSNWDDVTNSFIRSMYRWNMQFHKDDSIKGDYDVKPTGSTSLVAKEVRARQINDLAAQTANPMDAPYIKRGQLNKLRAEANELGFLVNTDEEIAADPMAKMQQEISMKTQQLDIAERESKINMSNARADRDRAEAARQEALAALDKVIAVDRKLDSVFVALRAAGIAVQQPSVAAAADDILRSSGWVDATPKTSIANLGAPGGPSGPAQQVPPGQAGPSNPDDPTDTLRPDMAPESGQVGARRGIETQRLEQ